MKEIILISLFAFLFHVISEQQDRNKLAEEETTEQTRPTPLANKFPEPGSNANNNLKPTVRASGSQCDGRTHCSQMHSCAEAKYFLSHCPNTEMDGDNDGIPCERQWCKEY